MQDRTKYIRNFCIIAHIDHGKSTLADRIIEKTGLVTNREMRDQVLDTMDLEREKGITIKSQAVRMNYKAKDGHVYLLNLIDTPGHVDFTYEVSRSLAACDGVVLVIDAAQGIEAQTLANVYLAMEHHLEIIPVINKIDLPSANIDYVKDEIEEVLGLDTDGIPLISAKNGINIEDVLEAVVNKLPCPEPADGKPLRALIFDSIYDAYKGIIVYIRVKEGSLKVGDYIYMMNNKKEFLVSEIGYFKPGGFTQAKELLDGEVGYFTASIKNVKDSSVGDTVTLRDNKAASPLAGYKKVNSMVFCGIYPADGSHYGDLRDALDKLKLNDASLSFEAESSVALGFGFRCGFLGLLHMEIIQERIEREFELDIVTTAPSVIYKIIKTDGTKIDIANPTNMPEPGEISKMEEPIVRATIMTPSMYTGTIMELCQERRGIYGDLEYIEADRVIIHYRIPLNEIIYDFFDALKSRTRGYASLDYELDGYEESKLVKLDILLKGEIVDALSFIVHKDKAYARGRRIAEKLKETLPRQNFEIPIQASVGAKVIARETVRAYRKDVTAKCYGGDISRKRKLLEKQKAGKKRMRQIGSVEVPQEAFMSVLKLDT